MRVLIVGDWHSELHEEGMYHALQELKHDVFKFSWHQYFIPSGIGKWAKRLFLKAQNKYMIGPVFSKLNADLIEYSEEVQPDLVFVYRGTHILSNTLRVMKENAGGLLVFGYNNDDPFSAQYPRWKWRHFLASVPEYDLTLAYRHHNIPEYLGAGAKKVELLRSWFIPERNYPVELTAEECERFGCDVVFIGHYEDDERLNCLEEVARQGWDLKIYGPGYEWDSVLKDSDELSNQLPVQLVWGEDYNRALNGAKIALCFLSKLNRDTYTRRCFEIPASGVVLMSVYTEDLASLFSSGKEAMFFRDSEELCKTIKQLLCDESLRKQIAKSGNEAIWNDGHDVASRMNLVVDYYNELKGNRN